MQQKVSFGIISWALKRAGGRKAFVFLGGCLGLLIGWLGSTGLELLSAAEEPLSLRRSPVPQPEKRESESSMLRSSSEQAGTGSTPASADTGGTESGGAYPSQGISGMDSYWAPPLRDHGDMSGHRRLFISPTDKRLKRNKTLWYLRIQRVTNQEHIISWHRENPRMIFLTRCQFFIFRVKSRRFYFSVKMSFLI